MRGIVDYEMESRERKSFQRAVVFGKEVNIYGLLKPEVSDCSMT